MSSAGQQVILQVHAQEKAAQTVHVGPREDDRVLPQAQGTMKQTELPGEMQTTYINLEAPLDVRFCCGN